MALLGGMAVGGMFMTSVRAVSTLVAGIVVFGVVFQVADPLMLLAVFVITMLIMGGINITIERVAYRRLRNAPRLAPLITAVGMSFILEGAMYVWRGAFNVHYPDLLPSGRVVIGDRNKWRFHDNTCQWQSARTVCDVKRVAP